MSRLAGICSGVSMLCEMPFHPHICITQLPMVRFRRQRGTDDPGYESCLQAALDGLANGTYSNPTEASWLQDVCAFFFVFSCFI
jgi:hypothetical protein